MCSLILFSVCLVGGALSTVCIINLLKATLETVEYTPVGPVLNIMQALKLVEDTLLFWIPLLGAALMILLLLVRVFHKLCGTMFTK